MYWHELSWKEIAQLDKKLPVVIPLGSCEQHGLHLPLFVDSIQIGEIVRRLNERRRDGLIVLPVLWLGSSHHHLDFPGTVSVKPTIYAEMIKSMAVCILKAGFQNLFFLNGHGGNEIPAAHALTELITESEQADRANIVLASWWKICASVLNAEILGMESEKLSHACEYETSAMAAIRPDLVNMKKLDPGAYTSARPWLRYEGLYGFKTFARYTVSGSVGRPEVATEEKGERLLKVVTDHLSEVLEDFSQWHSWDKIGAKL